jgi:hypothetical protein
MQVLQRIRNNPIVVLGVMAAALFTWVVLDYLAATNKSETVTQISNTKLKKFNHELPEPPSLPLPVRPSSVDMLPKVKPGMTRVEVERLIGPPKPDQIQAVTETNGRLTYCTAYELEEAKAPMTIRPIKSKTTTKPSNPVESKTHVTLEYDASKPGHPLIEIRYDTLF